MQTLALENYGLAELNNEEMQETDGGYSISPWLWQSAVATFLYNCIGDWPANSASYSAGKAAANR